MSGVRRIFVLVALALVVAPLAARAPLFDPDEGLHAAIAQEMVLRRDYVTPTFLGEPFLDKPILFFWAEAASLAAFGNREAAVRLPPLLFGMLGMIGVAALGRSLFDETTGLIAGLVYGTMVLPLGVSEVAVHDVAVVPFMCAACAALVGSVRPNGEFRRNLLLAVAAGVALGLSILTKGLVGVVFAGILGTCLVVRTPKAIGRLLVFFAIAGLVAIAVALPWYVAMERAHPGYLHYYFVERHLQGYLTATQRHAGRGWWYYIPIAIGGTLPWTGYLVGGLGAGARGAKVAAAHRLPIVVWAWFLAGFVFLSIGESKLATYALPLFPALAILVADRIVSSGSFGGRFAYGLFAVTLAILPIGALAAVATKFGGVGSQHWAIVSFITAAIAAIAIRIRPWLTAPPETTAGPVLLLPMMALCGLMVVAPLAARWMSARDLAMALNAGGTLPPNVSVLDERVGSLVFYLSPPLRADASPARVSATSLAEAVARIRTGPADAVLAVRDNDLARFTRMFTSPPSAFAHAGTFTIYRLGVLREALPSR